MENDQVIYGDYVLKFYQLNTLIIGSGAAALNAAISLHSFGVQDILIATEHWSGGTSFNAGSDKQTYYKLSISGKEPDSVYDMARDLFNGKCIHGDIALCEAQGSIRAFMRLVELGVEFPSDEYGSFPGYKTDHDPRSRATSAGPYTSKRIFEKLSVEVRRRQIRVLDRHHCIALLTDEEKNRVIGAVAINTDEKDLRKAFVLFQSENIILGTGGPAGIYQASVYPLTQTGSTGMALMAGATGQNFTESQFGIASVKFRWNLSGSYQQAIPAYISRNKDGSDEREFLNDHFPDINKLASAIFLKGYQWPFDPRKVQNYGSSCIDLLVDREVNELHRDVFLDFTKNPSGKNGETFSFEILDLFVKEYLRNCDALKETPLERLKAINPPAVSLYLDHGIDIASEQLQIAVCAQHNNGGLKGNIWWESDLKHLFPVGEVNGSHGVSRPGGSALNSGQVGSFRAARYISKKYRDLHGNKELNQKEIHSQLEKIFNLANKWQASEISTDLQKYFSEIRQRMSGAAGIRRNPHYVKKASGEAYELMKSLPGGLAAKSVQELSQCFRLLDYCLTHYVYLEAVRYYIENGGRSRGSYIVEKNDAGRFNPDLCKFDRDVENKIIEIKYVDERIDFHQEVVRDIPEQDLWFEKVWKEYLEDN